MNKNLVLLYVILIVCFSCKQEKSVSTSSKVLPQIMNVKFDDKVNEKYVSNFNKSGSLIIQYSNILYKVNEGNILIPIFKGSKGSLEEEKLKTYLIDKGEIQSYNSINEFEITDFYAPGKKGEMKKTLFEFLSFYKNNILKDVDIEHPSDFGQENSEWFITYDFDYQGVPCYMTIQIMGSEKRTMSYRSVYEIQPDEHMDHFFYSIFLNGKSQYKK